MKLGIVGLPNVGKSSLFNSLTNANIESANYPFCTIDPNVGVVNVPDERLMQLAKLYNSEKITPAVVKFWDIAGLVKGANSGEGLGNKFLSYIREVDAIIHVVRCFEDSNVTHVEGEIDPKRDIEIINLELILSDLDIIEKYLSKIKKNFNSGNKTFLKEINLLEKIKEGLNNSISARDINLDLEEIDIIKKFDLLSFKPVLYAANVSENDLLEDNKLIKQVKDLVGEKNVVVISAKLEEDMSELSYEEKKEFLKELNIKETGLDKLIKSSYDLLNLMSFFTSGPKETRAWTIKKNTKAPQAAGKIHSDFEKGFIKAEVIYYKDLINSKSYVNAKNNGLVRIEGKDYIIKDGDVILFRFNV